MTKHMPEIWNVQNKTNSELAWPKWTVEQMVNRYL